MQLLFYISTSGLKLIYFRKGGPCAKPRRYRLLHFLPQMHSNFINILFADCLMTNLARLLTGNMLILRDSFAIPITGKYRFSSLNCTDLQQKRGIIYQYLKLITSIAAKTVNKQLNPKWCNWLFNKQDIRSHIRWTWKFFPHCWPFAMRIPI